MLIEVIVSSNFNQLKHVITKAQQNDAEISGDINREMLTPLTFEIMSAQPWVC